ncbi:hypothetical protein JMM81_10645 [Bacillus sp. V3B]|uniref:hypothetical protein n=1 Tax=Bacillus sp. V3B TaxID=2804915 RepID=UPI00210F1622|nr:hypothetical protein [Bacillus sp. V3B]MCQ6275417.1 hypothetical protein [Bacillus sp. V3B]
MRQRQVYRSPISAILWSIALPGLGQIYNRYYIPAFLLIGLEFLINLYSNLNLAILYSFNGDFLQAHEVINYEWGLFYPSIYGFAIWQAYNHAKANNYKVEGKGLVKKTYFTGFFFGMVIGMNLGLYWHNHKTLEQVKYLYFLHFPVYNGLILGLLGALLGALIEKTYRKNSNRKK